MIAPRTGEDPVDWLQRLAHEGEADEEHAVLICDPQTGTRHVVGPFDTRLDARVGAELIKARYVQDDPEFADLQTEVVLYYPVSEVLP